MRWFEEYRRQNHKFLPNHERSGDNSILLSLVNKERLQRILERMLDETEFLAAGGIRALSKYYGDHPFSLELYGNCYTIQYDPGDSTSDLFGGNSNWRGPVWMPVNYLIVNALKNFGAFYHDEFKIECPRNSDRQLSLTEVADELTRRLLGIFERNEQRQRPVFGPYNWFYGRPENRDLVLFHEYFHGDNSRGLGASHQTGWTALVVNLFYGMENHAMM